jgi:hypothetical protein
MNAKKSEKADTSPNPRLEAERADTDRLVAGMKRDADRRIATETDKHEAAVEAQERFVESIMDEDEVGDVDVRLGGALPADRPIGVNASKVPAQARKLQIEAAMDNKRAEARNRNASRYPFVDGAVEPDPHFAPLYEASARDPAAVNNTEAARVPNASHVGFTPFEPLEGDEEVPVSPKTQEEMDRGAEMVGAREKGQAAPRRAPKRKTRAGEKKEERASA